MMELREFARIMGEAAIAFEEGFPEVMDEAARVVQDEAKAMIGHYQRGIEPFDDWKPLAESTVEEKSRLGFSPPDNPLERTGLLRESIERAAGPMEAVVGSNDEVAVFQELGTKFMPPRSFLGAAAVKKQSEVVEIIWGASKMILLGRSREIGADVTKFAMKPTGFLSGWVRRPAVKPLVERL